MKTKALFIALVTILTASAAFPANIKPLPNPDTDPPGFTIQKVGDGIYAAFGGDDDPAESNAGFVIGTTGVAVIDTFEDTAPARDLLAAIRSLTKLPIRWVVNTHYHLDHTGGNSVFAEIGATILAHRNVRAWERTENLKFFGVAPKPEKRAYVDGLTLPDMVYSDAVDLYLGSHWLVQVRHRLGHTGGDSVVTVPDADVVFGGDLIWQRHVPNLIDASTDIWVETLDRLLAEHPHGTFVPGHGNLASADDVRAFRGYLVTLRERVGAAKSAGKSGPELVDTVVAELAGKYGQWGFFHNFVKRNVELTRAELEGTKRLPPKVAE
jgi:cyclase